MIKGLLLEFVFVIVFVLYDKMVNIPPIDGGPPAGGPPIGFGGPVDMRRCKVR